MRVRVLYCCGSKDRGPLGLVREEVAPRRWMTPSLSPFLLPSIRACMQSCISYENIGKEEAGVEGGMAGREGRRERVIQRHGRDAGPLLAYVDMKNRPPAWPAPYSVPKA